MKQEVLRIERASCMEKGVMQLDNFSLSIFSGEIIGLLPVNNHGLTALLRLLQHNIPLRSGYVYYREEQVNSWRNMKHRGNRIGLIQSESCLVEGLTVADNIFVLRPGFKSMLIHPALLHRQLLPFLASIGIQIAADAYVEELNPFERIVVDVLKAVVAGCRLIVLRDISAELCEEELQKIHVLLRHYVSQGFSFLYIDFHFEDMNQICDQVALMSNGRIIKVLDSKTTTSEAFVSYTEGYSRMVEQFNRFLSESEQVKPVFEVRDLCGECVNHLDFSVAAGECLVLQDVDNHVFRELLLLLSGERNPVSGGFFVQGKPADLRGGRELAVIQELPTKTMLFQDLSYLDNLCFTLDHRLTEIWRSVRVREGIRREYEPLLGSEVFDMRVDLLSEKQKYELVYHRIANQKPEVVFCVQPFRRADIELRMQIWELLKMLLDKQIAVVILAVNLADSLSLADRLIRLKQGYAGEIYRHSEFSMMPVRAPWVNDRPEE